MFTGIVTDVAEIVESSNSDSQLSLTFAKPAKWTDLSLGESIATNGVCLTVAEFNEQTYTTILMQETLQKSSFGMHIPKRVNLERSLRADTRLGGHFVQGHVDGTGEVVDVQKGESWVVSIRLNKKDSKLVVYKGSIAINGVSLTVASVKDDVVTVSLVQHTIEHTTFAELGSGDTVNIEYDIFGKYIANYMEAIQSKS